MQPTPRVIEVDGIAFNVQFAGFHTDMTATSPAGETVRLQPWRLRQHLAALRQSLFVTTDGLRLDTRAFSSLVLGESGVSDDLAPGFSSLALWWAAGGDPAPHSGPALTGWLDLGPARVNLRPWSNGERLQALGRCLSGEGDAASLDTVAYLEAMLSASVVGFDPPLDAGDLDAAATARLLDVVVELNAPAAGQVDSVLASAIGDSEHLTRATLRLCRSLGWTPSQVWSAPAAEVDRLLALLERLEPAPPSAPAEHSPGLADLPDAVVIRIEDD